MKLIKKISLWIKRIRSKATTKLIQKKHNELRCKALISEYNLIQQKKSKLSANNRDIVVEIVEKMIKSGEIEVKIEDVYKAFENQNNDKEAIEQAVLFNPYITDSYKKTLEKN